jgi:hypothetical protein
VFKSENFLNYEKSYYNPYLLLSNSLIEFINYGIKVEIEIKISKAKGKTINFI